MRFHRMFCYSESVVMGIAFEPYLSSFHQIVGKRMASATQPAQVFGLHAHKIAVDQMVALNASRITANSTSFGGPCFLAASQ